MVKNLKIRTKLMILVLFLLAGLIFVGLSALRFMDTINQSSTEIANNMLPSIIAAEEMSVTLSDVRVQELQHVISQNAAEMDAVNTTLDELAAKFEKQYNDYLPIITNDTDRRMIADIKTTWDKYLSIGSNMIVISSENRTDEAMAIMNSESKAVFDELTAKCEELVAFNKMCGDEDVYKRQPPMIWYSLLSSRLRAGLQLLLTLRNSPCYSPRA